MPIGVMMVDDEAVARNYVAQMRLWRRGDFELRALARSAPEALERLAQGDIDILLLDVFMPEMDGVELSRRVARQFPAVGMVAISNYDQYDYVREILKNGAQDYLLKTRLDEASLLQVLENVRTRTHALSRDALRERAAAWLQGQGQPPFPIDGSRLGVVLFTQGAMGSSSVLYRELMAEGLLRLLEGGGLAGEDLLSVWVPPSHILLFVRFYDQASLAAMQARLHTLCHEGVLRVEKVYPLRLWGEICPPMIDNQAMFSYLSHRFARREEEAAPQRRITLTIAQQKQLLHAMEEKNIPATLSQIQDILQTAQQAPQTYPLIVKEVVDVLAQAAAEYSVSLPSEISERVYQWLGERTPQEQLGDLSTAVRTMLQKALLTERGQYSPAVSDAMLYLRERYGQPIGLAETAQAVGCNSSYLSRAFHHETGMTLTEFLTQVRIGEARKLLLVDIPLKEIATRVGFAHYNYFLRVFKQETGQTPKQFVHQNRQQR